MARADCWIIGTFHKLLGAQRPINSGSLVKEIRTVFSLQMIIFFLSRIETILFSTCTDSDGRFWVTGILCAILALIGRLGRRSSPSALACMMFLVAEMTLGPLGVITSLFKSTSFLTILMVAPESAHASSSLSSLKQENWVTVATGRDGDVAVVTILLVRGRLRSLLEVTLINLGVVVLLWLLLEEGGV